MQTRAEDKVLLSEEREGGRGLANHTIEKIMWEKRLVPVQSGKIFNSREGEGNVEGVVRRPLEADYSTE